MHKRLLFALTAATAAASAGAQTKWDLPAAYPANNCFYSGSNGGVSDPDRGFKPMRGYANFHSTEAKTFLGHTIAAQTTADPAASLREALDTLAAHPNVGPFIGKQLIQRLGISGANLLQQSLGLFGWRPVGGHGDALLERARRWTFYTRRGQQGDGFGQISCNRRATRATTWCRTGGPPTPITILSRRSP